MQQQLLSRLRLQDVLFKVFLNSSAIETTSAHFMVVLLLNNFHL
jgi:hypothetical protein